MRSALLMAAIAMPFSLSSCFAGATISNRVTLTISDNGVIKEGSSTWTSSFREMLPPLTNSYAYKVEGRPVVIALSEGRKLYLPPVLTTGFVNRGAATLAERSMQRPPKKFDTSRLSRTRYIASRTGASAFVKCPDYRISGARPESITDPAALCMVIYIAQNSSASVVRPLDKDRDRGISIVSITVEITNKDEAIEACANDIFPCSVSM